MGTEIEAAFDIADRGTARRLRALATLAGQVLGPERVRVVRDTYLDTPRQALRRAGWALRRREEAGRITLELKSLDAPRGMIRRRREIAIEIASLLPPDRWPEGELRDTVDRLRCGAPLEPLFVVRQVRRARTGRRGEAVVAELSIDTLRIAAGGRIERHRVVEVEAAPAARRRDVAELVRARRERPLEPAAAGDLSADDVLATLRDLGCTVTVSGESDAGCEEVPGGRVSDVRAVTRRSGAGLCRVLLRSWLLPPALDEAPPVRALSVSIAGSTRDEARYLAGLLAGRLPLVPRDGAGRTGQAPGSPPWPGDATAARVGAEVLRAQARKLRENHEGALRGEDPEHVHEMRVACRRARFALKLFEGMVGPDRPTAVRAELAWLATMLGAVRDLDVLFGRLDADLARTGAEGRFAALLRTALEGRRAVAAACLLDALSSERFRDILAALERSTPLATAGGKNVDRETFGSGAIRRAAAKVVRAVRRLGTDDPEGLHRLRILCKRLRYIAEFFEPLERTKVRPLIRAGRRFQAALGASRDAAISERLLRGLLAERLDLAGEPGFALALGALVQVQHEALHEARGAFGALWRSHGGPVGRRHDDDDRPVQPQGRRRGPAPAVTARRHVRLAVPRLSARHVAARRERGAGC